MKTKALSIAGGGLALALLLGTVSMPLADDYDFSKLAPEPSEIASELGAAKGRLVAAIAAAEKEVGGIVQSASVKLDTTPASVEIVAYEPGSGWNLTVDLASGKVLNKTKIERLPGAPVTGEPVVTESGLSYYDLVVGDGPLPSAPTSIVKVHYSGWLTNGDVFDSSVERGQPLTFALSGVIPGWSEGVGSMRVGGKRKLVIPYNLAYGARGRPGIPPKAMLIFDVELIEIVNE